MRKKLTILAVAALALGLMVVPAISKGGPSGQAGNSNTGHVYLREKDPEDWSIVEDGAWGKMKYKLAGPEFCFVFNGHGLEPETGYSLIYYADPWPGDNPGALIARRTSNDGGNIHLAGCKELDMDLPWPPDQNYDAPCEGYAEPCPGAKIWLVLSGDYDESNTKMIGWDPSEYLFEAQSILYDDTQEEPP